MRGFHAPTSFFVVCRVLQWWLSWQSGLFRYHRSVVRIQSSSNFITEHCQLFWTDKNKEKEAGDDPILTSFYVAILFSSYSRRGQGFESRRMSNLKTFIFNLFLCVRLRVKKLGFSVRLLFINFSLFLSLCLRSSVRRCLVSSSRWQKLKQQKMFFRRSEKELKKI